MYLSAYADDLVLLAPTAGATCMRLMLHVCDHYATEYRPNVMLMLTSLFSCKSVKPAFYIGGKEIKYVEEWPHLGNLLHANGSDQKDITNKRTPYVVRLTMFFAILVNAITKLQLMRLYCSSLYGSVLWDLSPYVEDRGLCFACRKGLRRVWKWNIHHSLVPASSAQKGLKLKSRIALDSSYGTSTAI